MSFLLLSVVFGGIPIAWYFWREHKLSTPSLQWPGMCKILGLEYEANPPRMAGTWNGRKVVFEAAANGATVTAWLAAPSRLRVECGPTEVVTRRSGMLVPDAVEAVDRDFRDKLLARCSDKAAGVIVFDSTMQQRLASMPAVDFVGQESRVSWTVPLVCDVNATEALLGALCAIADGLESFPQSGAKPNA